MTQALPLYYLGIDIGSTTVKVAITNEQGELLYSDYKRHYADIQGTLAGILSESLPTVGECRVMPAITGSGGLALATHLNVSFVQEVVAVADALQEFAPKTDVAIELGGEDAKIIYFTGGIEQRMNGICAGGTGSFIDQMASLLKTDAAGLNEYAKDYKALYPIAARCGVFAKADIQPLINEGASKEDLAASIFQAVVNQTISGLACGKPIRGNVAFLGGPLHFLTELKAAFVRTLNLTPEATIDPNNSHLFAAMGSAMNAKNNNKTEEIVVLTDMIDRLKNGIKMEFEVQRMEPLFKDEADFETFKERHARATVRKSRLSEYKGNCYLGIDAGSTTTKVALVGEDGSLLYSFYQNNNGSPIKTAIKAVKEIAEQMPEDCRIVRACSTGYGEALLKSAFMLDEGEVETVAHYYAASFFDPSVDCVLDIGGQDMKCIRIKNHAVDSVQLNEACSSGCGSFIETFAKSLNFEVADFANVALFSENPIDLGTRCTVFMNSKVKQAQKEGASVSDISAGLAYSVIKNALYKVIKVTDAKDLGSRIVVQGGTFYNNAVLRALEKIVNAEVIRPDIAGIMGAFGAALIAREHYEGQPTTMLSFKEIQELTFESKMTRCQGCTNHCLLTINIFPGNRRFISGNRCEKGLGKEKSDSNIPNLMAYKLKRFFNYEPLEEYAAPRGTVGIPRVLNMYENYPFWFTFFNELGYRVVLSPASSRKIYEMGIESIPSESECYPAKLAHGHVMWLIKQGVKYIFLPCVNYERIEFPEAGDHYNCPIVAGYGENIKNNVEDIITEGVDFSNPFMSFESEEILTQRLIKVMEERGIGQEETKKAAKKAWAELTAAHTDMQKAGEAAIKYIKDNDIHGIVLAGRPYHADPEINHGIPELITSYGVAVLTEDSVSHLRRVDRPTIVVDQWMYHSRLYAAASYVRENPNLDLIQLNSFGCGLGAVTTDQVSDILTGSGKIYTVLKIDEVNNLGAARIRVRSLLSAINDRKRKGVKTEVKDSAYHRKIFTEDMRKNYTILCPQMSPIHFDLIVPAFNAYGYNMIALEQPTKNTVDVGLQHVNNDACYPSIIVVGEMIEALKSGKYDIDRTAVLITQTGGGCRATNYIAFIRRALKKAGMEQVPVISLSTNGIEKNPGFRFSYGLVKAGIQALVYGDVFMKCVYRTRPYEMYPGDVNALHEKWKEKVLYDIAHGAKWSTYKNNLKKIIKDFDEIPLKDIKKPRVGVVGEILVKFLPAANNYVVDLLEAEGAEAVVPDLLDFLCYASYNSNFKHEQLGKPKKSKVINNLLVRFYEFMRRDASKAFAKSKRFEAPMPIADIAKLAEPISSIGNQTGEGWFLTGEMLELVHSGARNIVCLQPFGCLPNHIVGKGVIKEIRRQHPEANIVAVDYDPGASEVNQLNRIKLMLATAQKNLKK